MNHSPFLAQDENTWMKSVLQIIRTSSLYFQPQIRTKIMNEGWASYWHETLFLQDDRIAGHEVDFARVNAAVTSMPRVGLNPYALGMRLFYHVENRFARGCYSDDFDRIRDVVQRETYHRERPDTRAGQEAIFALRENYCDFTLINRFVDQDFVDSNKLFVAGERINRERMTREYYVKSRKAEDYRAMLFSSLYHPPVIEVDPEHTTEQVLYLKHRFEGKPLVSEYIANTMLGIAFLWGGSVRLETSEAQVEAVEENAASAEPPEIHWVRVVYVMENKVFRREEVRSDAA